MSLGQFLRTVAQETGASFIWSAELDSETVSVEVEDVSLLEVLQFVARRLDADLTGQGGVYYIGQAQQQDRAHGVFRVGRFTVEEIESLLGTILTDDGSYVAFEGGLVVVSEAVGVLRRVASVLEQLESVEQGAWLVQLLMVETVDRDNRQLGIDTALDVEVAAAFSSASASSSEVSGEARASLVADIERQTVSIYAQPLFVLLDGGESTLKRTEIVPVPQYTTLETGVVTTSGYSEVEIGLELAVSIREIGQDAAALEFDVSLGELVGFVDDQVPIRTEESLTGRAAVVSGGTYLLGSLDRGRQANTVSGPAQLLRGRDYELGRLEVWALCTRVGRMSADSGPETNTTVHEAISTE